MLILCSCVTVCAFENEYGRFCAYLFVCARVLGCVGEERGVAVGRRLCAGWVMVEGGWLEQMRR